MLNHCLARLKVVLDERHFPSQHKYLFSATGCIVGSLFVWIETGMDTPCKGLGKYQSKIIPHHPINLFRRWPLQESSQLWKATTATLTTHPPVTPAGATPPVEAVSLQSDDEDEDISVVI